MTISKHVYTATALSLPIPQPDITVYSQGFEGLSSSNPDGWVGTSASAAAANYGASTAHSGSTVMTHTIPTGTAVGATTLLQKTITGLTLSTVYKLSAWVKINPLVVDDFPVGIGVAGKTMPALTPQSKGLGWREYVYTFTATSTSHVMQLRVGVPTAYGTGAWVYWDDIKLSRPTPDIIPAGTNLPIKGGSISLDEGWSPYVQGELSIPMPSMRVWAALDPRKNVRLTITTSVTFGADGFNWNPEGALQPFTRTFNVMLVSRRINHGDSTVALRFNSNESLMQDYARVATTTLEPSNNSGLAAIRNALSMSVPGAAPTIVGTIPSTTITNLLPNPGGEVNTAGWIPGFGNGVAVARQGAPYNRTGTSGLGFYTDGGLPLTVIAAPSSTVTAAVVVTAGKDYTFSVWSRCTKQLYAFVGFRWHDTNGTIIGRDEYAESKLLTTDGWTRLTFSATAPPGAVFCWPLYTTDGSVPQATFFVDDAMLHEGKTPLPSFTGSTPSTPEVTYSWVGTANASASRAVTVGAVDYAAMLWAPGVSAWDYIKPILAQLQLRLFCDESNVWRLVGNSYAVNGSIRVAAGSNVTDASETIDRVDDAPWFDAVVVRYSWTDASGTAQQAVDVASLPGYTKVKTIDLDLPFPGIGAASYILSRATGRGKVYDLEAISDYNTTPGMEVVSTLPDSPIVTGYISGVTWGFDSDRMTIKSRGLIDTPSTAWILQPTGKSWQDIPVGTKWNTYTA